MKPIIKYFDRLEDKIRDKLSHRSIFYALIGGVTFVLFWRGVWHTADILQQRGGVWGYIFYEPNTIVWTTIIMLITGLFVSLFIGDRIILSGLKHEKKVDEKTEEEIIQEESEIKQLVKSLSSVQKDIEEIKNLSRSKFNRHELKEKEIDLV